MRLKTLRLVAFRSYQFLEVELKPRINFFIGDNGQGKTNLLEAIDYCSRGSSFRPKESGSLIRLGEKQARIQIDFDSSGFIRRLKADLEPQGKKIELDRKPTKFSTVRKFFSTIVFSPESLGAIKNGPDVRRELIDSICLSVFPNKAPLFAEFSKALRSRNALLRVISEGDRRPSTLKSLESLDRIFLLLATSVTEVRLELLQKIQPFWEASAKYLFREEEGLFLQTEYLISDQEAINWNSEQVFDAISRRAAELKSREMHLGTSLIGPQKHDIRFMFNGRDSRYYCSQGQQRALILGLKMAEIDVHRAAKRICPILLLDDVLSELDMQRRTRLMDYLMSIDAQVLLTATDLLKTELKLGPQDAIFKVVNVDRGTVTDFRASAVQALDL